MTTTLNAYKDNLYSEGDSDKHLLECVANVSDSDCSANEKKRLSELYFDPSYYEENANSSTVTLDDFKILPDQNQTVFKTNLIGQVSSTSKSFSSIGDIDSWFTECLKKATLATLAQVGDPNADDTFPDLTPSDFKGHLLAGNFPDALEDKYTSNTVSVFRPYMAWKHIDHMYPEEERTEYFLIERMHTLTKLVFILSILKPETENSALLDTLNKIMTFMVKQSLEYTSVGDPRTNASIDDSTMTNVELSRKVRADSESLLENKEIVQKFQDNLRSLVDVDKSVQSARTRAWYMMLFLVVVLVLSVAGMVYAYARGRTGEIYLLGGVLVLCVMAFEAFKGGERLMLLPASIVG